MQLIQCHQVNEQNVYLYSRERRRLGARQVLIAPPFIPPGKLARWESELHPFADVAWVTEGSWVIYEDHREDKLYTEDGVYELGTEQNGQTFDGVGPVPQWLATSERPSIHHSLINGEWVLDVAAELAWAKENQISLLAASCEAEIYSGFESNALGSQHHYPAKDKDQQNLTASVLDSTVPGIQAGWQTPFWCEINGVWDFRMHSADQIQQVGRDGKERILSCLALNKSLADQVLAATTRSEVESVVWVSPA